MASTVYRRTPGVYVTELTAFPPSVVGVQTAIPAFIGFTEKADISGKPVYLKPIKIGAMVDFEAVFGRRYKYQYGLESVTAGPTDADKYDFKVFAYPEGSTPEWRYYKLTEAAKVNRYNLYDSMRLFYANGGGTCYVVSVGHYGEDITEEKLMLGLAAIEEQVGPTMLVVPEAIHLDSITKFGNVAKDMLRQCSKLQDRVAILDVYGAGTVTKATLDDTIAAFRGEVGNLFLNYGMAYFPFLDTSVYPVSEVDYTSIDSEGVAPYTKLKEVLTWERINLYGPDTPDGSRAKAVQDDIDKLPTALDVVKLNQNLTNSLPLLVDIERIVTVKNDVLPPSPAMAGIYTLTDATKGVWNAPANITLSAVEKPSFKLDNQQQADLNVPVDGKAVNAIREFPSRGTLVWGARTLDGNSNDYRYIQVRRTLIYIEQSIKNALDQFVFAPNDGNTWATVTAMVSSFLQGVWSQGGLMGATASEAFSVQCGIGSTMTGQDILDGYMRVQVVLQMIRPAEFIELTFKQKMEGVG
jgi:uncharacterized protein